MCAIMVGFIVAFSALLTVQAAFANPVRSPRTPYRVKDSHHVPRGWKRVRRAPADHVIDLQIGVKQSNFQELERHLYEGKRCGTLHGLLQPMSKSKEEPESNYDLQFRILTTNAMASIFLPTR